MKKISFILVLLLFCRFSYGFTTPLKVSVFGNGAETDAFPGGNVTVAGLDLGILGSRTQLVYGVQLSGFSSNAQYLYGLQLSPLGAGGDVTGLQLAAGILGSVNGAAVSVFSTSDVKGVDLTLMKMHKSLNKGVLINAVSYNDEVQGLQLGIINANYGRVIGVQIGAFNYARELHGLQIGLFNMAFNARVYGLPFFNFRF